MSIVDDLQTVTSVGEDAPLDVATTAVPPPALPPLAISALLVTKADLIVALRAYLPHLGDIEVLDGGERFLLSVRPEHGPVQNGAG